MQHCLFHFHSMSGLNHQSHIDFTSKLFQQQILDQLSKIETIRSSFCSTKSGGSQEGGQVQDSLHAETIGQTGQGAVILPVTFTDEEIHMRECHRDTTALVKVFGKSTFFVTMTCNTWWPQITAQLKWGQTPFHRPDTHCPQSHSSFCISNQTLAKEKISKLQCNTLSQTTLPLGLH